MKLNFPKGQDILGHQKSGAPLNVLGLSAVQDSSIGDLVTQSLSDVLISVS